MNYANTYKHSQLTGKIIACALKVHKYFGLGFKEEIYERSLKIELEKNGISFASQVIRDIYYEGCLVGQNRVDLIVEDKVLVELKAVTQLDNDTVSRSLNYLKTFKIEVG